MNIIFHFKGTRKASKDQSFIVKFIPVVAGKTEVESKQCND